VRPFIVATSTGARRVLLGRIAGAHGIRGEVVIHSFAEPAENIAAYGTLTDTAGARAFAIESLRVTAKGVVARLEGVADRNAAEALKGVELYVDRERLPAVAEDEFYHADLVGLAAVDPQGTQIGVIVAVQNYGAGDLIEVRLAGAARTELVPFTDASVPEVNVKARRVVIVMPAVAKMDEPPDR
jgi:16S rRNA processing protein RimM